MAGWGLVVATILVLSNLAGVAVDFLFLLISQITATPGSPTWRRTPSSTSRVPAVHARATFISYRDMQTTQKLQYVLVSFQVLVLVFFAVAAIVEAVSGRASTTSRSTSAGSTRSR
jgi:amino acid transporter